MLLYGVRTFFLISRLKLKFDISNSWCDHFQIFIDMMCYFMQIEAIQVAVFKLYDFQLSSILLTLVLFCIIE